VSTQPGRSRRGSWRIVLPVIIVALVIVVPTAQFAGRVGEDLAGDVGHYAGMVVGAAAVLALAALVAYVFSTLYGVAPTPPPADPTAGPTT
jgi:hypothetical protein